MGGEGGRKKKKKDGSTVTDYCFVTDSVGERKHNQKISSAEEHQNNIATKEE